MSQGPVKHVYNVIERLNRKPFWLRIGSVFLNKDGSETLVFDAYPTSTRVQLRTPDKDDAATDESAEVSDSVK
jgi:hypothetical protein